MTQLGEGHEPGPWDAVREQPAVARVDHGVRAAVQDQRAGTDAPLPQAAGVPCSRGCLGRPDPGVRWPGALELEEAVHEFRMVPDGGHRQGVFRVAAPRPLGRHVGGRRDQPHRGGGHRVGEGPARRGAHQDEAVDAFRVADRQFLGHHAAQARPHHVGPAYAGGVEHRDDVAGHVGDGERAGRPVAVPDAAVVHQHKPEVPPQFPQHGFPAETVQAHPLDQDQPRPPPVHGAAQLVGDPQRAAAGVPDPVHLAGKPVYIASTC